MTRIDHTTSEVTFDEQFFSARSSVRSLVDWLIFGSTGVFFFSLARLLIGWQAG